MSIYTYLVYFSLPCWYWGSIPLTTFFTDLICNLCESFIAENDTKSSSPIVSAPTHGVPLSTGLEICQKLGSVRPAFRVLDAWGLSESNRCIMDGENKLSKL